MTPSFPHISKPTPRRTLAGTREGVKKHNPCQFMVLMRIFMPLNLVYVGDIFGQ